MNLVNWCSGFDWHLTLTATTGSGFFWGFYGNKFVERKIHWMASFIHIRPLYKSHKLLTTTMKFWWATVGFLAKNFAFLQQDVQQQQKKWMNENDFNDFPHFPESVKWRYLFVATHTPTLWVTACNTIQIKWNIFRDMGGYNKYNCSHRSWLMAWQHKQQFNVIYQCRPTKKKKKNNDMNEFS